MKTSEIVSNLSTNAENNMLEDEGKVLDIIDQELLIKVHGFGMEEVKMMRNIWKKLSSRRINRK